MREQNTLFKRLFINLWVWLGGDVEPRTPPNRQLPLPQSKTDSNQPLTTPQSPRTHDVGAFAHKVSDNRASSENPASTIPGANYHHST